MRFFQYIPYLSANGIDLQTIPLLGNDYIHALYFTNKPPFFSVSMGYMNRAIAYIKAQAFDLLWIEKELFPWIPSWAEKLLNIRKVPYVVDYDDAVYYRYNLHHNLLIRTFLENNIGAVMKHANTVVVGNDYLAEYARRAEAPRIECLPTVVDLDRYPIYQKNNKQLRICWIGSPITAPYLSIIKDALDEVGKQTEAEIVLIGAGDHDPLPGLKKENLPWSEESEVANIQSCDIGIMPLPDEPFARGKCGYKLIQYMAAGLPVVASPVGINSRIVEQGKTGFLASSKEEWVQALVTLCQDAGLRSSMGKAGRQKVEQEYCLRVTAPLLLNILTTA
jgi:glycosyltransferase involved in cell wall biosynthesis